MCTRPGKLFLLTCISVFFFSCSGSLYKKDTQIFNNYLKTALGLSIPDDSMKYIPVSEYGCEGCIDKTITHFRNDPKALFIINKNTYKKYLEPKNMPRERYVIDTTERITRLKYHYSSIGVIQTANGQIYKMTHVDYMTADSVLASIK